MYISIGLPRSLKNIIDLLPHAYSRLRQEFDVYVSFRKLQVFFISHRFLLFACAATNRATWCLERSAQKTHTPNISSYSISSKDKQLCNFFCSYRHTRKNLLSFRSCRIYNSLKKLYNQPAVVSTLQSLTSVITNN